MGKKEKMVKSGVSAGGRITYRPEKKTEDSTTEERSYDESLPDEVKVLHVDDAAEFVEMAAVYLQEDNDRLNVVTETDPVKALGCLKAEDGGFDCVISDCSMPDMEMDGMEMQAEVRERYPEMPFVFFTGTPLSEFPPEVLAEEDTGHMQKAIDVKQFSNLTGWITETV